MQGGWGSMGAGAWGTSNAAANEPDSPPRSNNNRAQSYAAPANPIPVSSAPSASAYSAAGNGAASFKQSAKPNTDAKEAELKRRELELNQREQRLAVRERELASSGGERKKNWPLCLPMMYHDIAGEIPEHSRRVVREAYMAWWGLMLCLGYQIFTASVMLGYKVDNKVPSWFLSIIFFILGVPLAIILWYKRIYYAARDDSAVGYVAFFLFFFLHFAWCVFCAIGVQINAAAWCFSGFMAGFDAFNVTNFGGTIFMIGGALWAAEAAFSLWIIKDAYFFFRGQGGVKEAKSKASTEQALEAFKTNMGSGSASRV